ncbi:MAG: hypothetical protein JHC26_09030 [Thermofilum sp.]|jgi:hypothetical protein|uniref:hypothetical protein n=1 Tax=Thermofilum sp. TaxID=1961369 RepID=UPI0025851F87|nr:hypothetical protein [Thermofilum sp.]MCI4409222.1 hypothetical protein [Thermofilum sp.]
MSKETVENIYRKRYDTKQKAWAESSDILDTRFKIQIDTKELISKYRLSNSVTPVLSIPLAYDSSRGMFTLIETPTLQTSRIQGYYFTTTPSETTPDYYPLRIDSAHRLFVIEDNIEAKLNPITKASIFNTSVTANTNILSSGISPTNSPTVFRIYSTFNTGGNLIVTRTKSGTTINETLNSGAVLSANSPYIFDIIVESGETINLQYSVNATALVLKVIEIPTMTA